MNAALKKSLQLNKSLYFLMQYSFTITGARSFKRSYPQSKEIKLDAVNDKVSKESSLNKDEHTWVGPPHPVSNLRLKVFPTCEHLTKEETHFYEKSRETQEWNQQYWEAHNKDFESSRKSYMEKMTNAKNLDPKNCLSPEDMATFYREFLNKTYEKHISYNWKWYKRNFELLYLSAVAQLSKVRKFLKKDVP